MENPFDQFDATPSAASANPFDQFDAKGTGAVPNPFEDKPEPGVLSRVGSAIAGGARTGFQDLLTSGRQNTAAVTGDKVEAAPPDTDPRAAPIDWFSLPSLSGIEKGAYQATKGLVSGAPEMAGAIAGAGLGTAAVGGPEDPLAALAAPVGAALGAGGVSALRNFYPLYAEEKAKGLSDDEAWGAAKGRALKEGLITGAAFGLFEARPVFGAVKGLLSDTWSQAATAAAKKAAMDQAVRSTAVGPARNLAEQALVVQPGAAAAGQVASNAADGRPLGEGVANAAGSAAIGTAVPMGAHVAGKAVLGKGKGEAAPGVEPDATQPAPPAEPGAVGVPGAPSEKIAAVLNSNPAVEIEKAAERGKEAAQEAAPPADAPVEPASPPAEATPPETPPAEEPAPQAPPATPAEAVADASQHGTEEAQALLSPAFTEHKIRDTTGTVPEPRPAERAEPWKRPEPGETTTVTLPGAKDPVEATVHGYQGEGPGERVILELPDGTVRNPLTSGVSFTEHVIRNVTDQAMGLNRAERAAPWVPPAAPVNLGGALRASTRSMRWGDVPDPIAEVLLEGHRQASLKKVEDDLRSAGVTNLRPLSGGASSVVLDAGTSVVRLGEGKLADRPAIPEMLQPAASGSTANIRWEVLPKADTSGITEADVHAMDAALRKKGYWFSDPGTDNLGRVNGRLVVIDPGAVEKLKAAEPPHFTEHQIRDVTGEPPAARPAERAEPWQPPAKPEVKPVEPAEAPPRVNSTFPSGREFSFPGDRQPTPEESSFVRSLSAADRAVSGLQALGDKATPTQIVKAFNEAGSKLHGINDAGIGLGMDEAHIYSDPFYNAFMGVSKTTPNLKEARATLLKTYDDYLSSLSGALRDRFGGDFYAGEGEEAKAAREETLAAAAKRIAQIPSYDDRLAAANAWLKVHREVAEPNDIYRAIDAATKKSVTHAPENIRARQQAMAPETKAAAPASPVPGRFSHVRPDGMPRGYFHAVDEHGEIMRGDRKYGETPPAFKTEAAAEKFGRQQDRKNKSADAPPDAKPVEAAGPPKPEAEAPAHSLPDADRPPSLADDAVRARVASVLRDRLKALGLDDKIGLKVEHALEAVVNGETVSPNGRYFQKVIEVAMDAEGGVSRAFDHEVLHGLKDLGVFTDGEWNALSRVAESKWIKQYGTDTKPGYKELPKSKQVEEAIAHAFSDSEAVKYGGLIGRAIRNGRNLIEAIGNAMRGNGFTSARGLFDRVRAGDLADRTAGEGGGEAAHSLRDNSGNPVPVPDNSLRDRILRNPIVKRAANTSVAKSGAEYTKGMLDDFVMKATPMAIGSERAQATAKDFANDMRSVQDKYGQIDRMLTDHYTPAERSLMGSAIDEQSVMEQEGNIVPGKGLDRLTPDQRATATMLNDIAKQVWKGLYDAGIVTSPDGLPSYMPRMFVSVGDDGSVERLKGDGPGAGPINSIGRNLSTSGPQKRNHLTAAESEAAAKAKFGDNTTLVTDIRALPLALARSERSIAGRKLVDTIKKIGDQIGQETTADAEKPGFFTIDHPALKTYSHEKVGDEWVLTKKSLYISQEFEGPLRAVLSQKSGHLYNALMAFKGVATSLIMISPFIHNMVEWGRALPLLPGKVITGMIYFEGNRAKNDPALRAEAVRNGLVPIGQSHHADITGIAEDPQLAPGRSLPAKAIGAAAEAIGLGKNAADAVRRGIDKAGEFWHGTLLWDRIGDLQFGIYKNMKDKLAKEGMDAQTAGRTAAHLANRYAGALPAEAASNIARKAANLTFFSRSFTFGNIGVMKDVLNGLPRDVRAQISRDVGALNAGIAAKVASKAAMHAFLIDVGMFYGANALLQSGFSAMRGDESLDEIGKGYVDRVLGLLNRVKEHPLEALNPFGMAEKLTPNSQNEPGKEDRAYVGRDRDGTGIYLRNPVGKVGEEFRGWLTSPLEMFKRKESTLLRPAMEVLQNDKGFGRKVYDADDKTVAGMFRAAGDIAWHIMGSQLPLPSLEAASNLALGQGSQTINTLKTVGPLVGLSFSKGAPGGPENGLMFAEQTRARNAKVAAMPGINKLIDAGKTDDAVQKMIDLGMSRSEIAGHLKYREVPAARLNANSLKRFYGSATPEEQEQMERLLSRRP